MSQKTKISRACLFAAALAFSAGFAGKAMASDPVVGDSIAPPVNVNIGLFYNVFSDAGTFGALHGSNYTHDTKIAADITVGRYIRTFEYGGFEMGVQVYDEYYAFLGQQRLGVAPIGTPAPLVGAPGAGPIGPAHANLSANSGFAQPNIGAFIFPIKNPAAGQYLVIAPWISPPISSFNKNDLLNPSPNAWVYELEVGYRQTILGTQTTPNLSLELWGEVYGYGENNRSQDNIPAIDANHISAGDAFYGLKNPLPIPGTNISLPGTFREQPTEEIHVYAPYIFSPATLGFIAPGFYQSFGGKQTYEVDGLGIIDSGNRTNETQLRLNVGSFVSPTTQVELLGEYDVAAHGQQLARNIELRIATFF